MAILIVRLRNLAMSVSCCINIKHLNTDFLVHVIRFLVTSFTVRLYPLCRSVDMSCFLKSCNVGANHQTNTSTSPTLTPRAVAWYRAPVDVSTVWGQGPVLGVTLSSPAPRNYLVRLGLVLFHLHATVTSRCRSVLRNFALTQTGVLKSFTKSYTYTRW